MIMNRKSLTASAKILNISVDELKSYFLYEENFSQDFVDNIQDKLNLMNMVDMPGVITPKCLDIIEKYEWKLNNQAKIIVNLCEAIKERLPYEGFEKTHEYFKNYDPSK